MMSASGQLNISSVLILEVKFVGCRRSYRLNQVITCVRENIQLFPGAFSPSNTRGRGGHRLSGSGAIRQRDPPASLTTADETNGKNRLISRDEKRIPYVLWS